MKSQCPRAYRPASAPPVWQFLILCEKVLGFKDDKEVFYEPASGFKKVDFGQSIGEKTVGGVGGGERVGWEDRIFFQKRGSLLMAGCPVTPAWAWAGGRTMLCGGIAQRWDRSAISKQGPLDCARLRVCGVCVGAVFSLLTDCVNCLAGWQNRRPGRSYGGVCVCMHASVFSRVSVCVRHLGSCCLAFARTTC